jgi:hypothetical protein
MPGKSKKRKKSREYGDGEYGDNGASSSPSHDNCPFSLTGEPGGGGGGGGGKKGKERKRRKRKKRRKEKEKKKSNQPN